MHVREKYQLMVPVTAVLYVLVVQTLSQDDLLTKGSDHLDKFVEDVYKCYKKSNDSLVLPHQVVSRLYSITSCMQQHILPLDDKICGHFEDTYQFLILRYSS